MLRNYPDVLRVVPGPEQARMAAALTRFEKVLREHSQRLRNVRYVTGRRRALVFKLQAESAEGLQSWFLKFGVRPDEEIMNYVKGEAANTLRVHEAMAGSEAFRVSRPAAIYEDLGCFVLFGHTGERLDRLVMAASGRRGGAAAFEEARLYCGLAAGWLAHFQRRVALYEERSRTSADALMARAERELVILSLSAPGRVSESLCKTMRERFAALVGGFQPDDYLMTVRHNDFAPWNVLCDDGYVCVIDFADLTEGSRYFDAYQFVDAMDVLGNRILSNKSTILQLKDTFAQACNVISTASPDASQYFEFLCKLIRINAVLNNSKSGIPNRLWNRQLLHKYMREIKEGISKAPAEATG
jgi:hypothetical protein